VELLRQVARATRLRISFSVTTDRDDVRRRYEPQCESNSVRLTAIRTLRDCGLEVYATLAPLLPCDPERLAAAAIDATGRDLIGDPLHVRASKPRGAQSREVAFEIAERLKEAVWFDPQFQRAVIAQIQQVARRAGLAFLHGAAGFGRLLKD
jgi:DNA repair photolyase